MCSICLDFLDGDNNDAVAFYYLVVHQASGPVPVDHHVLVALYVVAVLYAQELALDHVVVADLEEPFLHEFDVEAVPYVVALVDHHAVVVALYAQELVLDHAVAVLCEVDSVGHHALAVYAVALVDHHVLVALYVVAVLYAQELVLDRVVAVLCEVDSVDHHVLAVYAVALVLYAVVLGVDVVCFDMAVVFFQELFLQTLNKF